MNKKELENLAGKIAGAATIANMNGDITLAKMLKDLVLEIIEKTRKMKEA